MPGKPGFRNGGTRWLELADRAEAAAEALGGPTYVGFAAKELLHCDILAAVQRAGFLDRPVFHGGAALRLCYGSARLGEDLDFSGGKRFEPASLSVLGAEKPVEQPRNGRRMEVHEDLCAAGFRIEIRRSRRRAEHLEPRYPVAPAEFGDLVFPVRGLDVHDLAILERAAASPAVPAHGLYAILKAWLDDNIEWPSDCLASGRFERLIVPVAPKANGGCVRRYKGFPEQIVLRRLYLGRYEQVLYSLSRNSRHCQNPPVRRTHGLELSWKLRWRKGSLSGTGSNARRNCFPAGSSAAALS